MDRKIVLLEVNEIPFRILEEYRRWNPRSRLARAAGECAQYETYAPDQGNLTPWVSWPSLHRGVSNEQHLILEFGQPLEDADREFPPIWKLLAAGGVKTGVFGSLHTYPLPENYENYAFFVPDTFAAGSECFPDKLSLYQQFNLAMARESARNVSIKVPWASAVELLRRSTDLGFRLRTMAQLGGQLVSERLQSWRKSRRRSYQSVLAFDIFFKQLNQTKPDFATFFTNHVASAMHRYWAAAFPEDYHRFDFDPKWVKTYSHEIEFALNKLDAFVGRLIDFVNANQEYQLWITTSLGQAAVESEPLETQTYVTDRHKFMAALGLEPHQWEFRPSMLPGFNLVVRDGYVEKFRERLNSLRIDNRGLPYREAEGGFFNLAFGHENLYKQPQIAKIGETSISFADLGIGNVEIEDKSGTSAYHIPEGMLIIYDPKHRENRAPRTQISTLDIAPALLRNFNRPVPEYMQRPAVLAN